MAKVQYEAYKKNGLTMDEFFGTRYFRIKHITNLQREKRLDEALRWQDGL
jgi:hypothetical protein